MELAYEVIWSSVTDSRLFTETGLTKAAMAKLYVIISVRILW